MLHVQFIGTHIHIATDRNGQGVTLTAQEFYDLQNWAFENRTDLEFKVREEDRKAEEASASRKERRRLF